MLAIKIEDLKICLNNKNLLMRKIAIEFELFVQKNKIDKLFNLFFFFS